jgi:HlyD family secretion protein
VKRSWMRFAVAGVVLSAAGVWWLSAGLTSPGDNLATASRQDFQVMVEAGGSLEAAVYFEMGPPSVKDFWSYNLTWLIPEGAKVETGQVVARFDGQELEDRLRDFRAELETVTQEKEKEQRQLEIQLKQLDLDLVEAEAEVAKVAVEAALPDELVPALELARTRRRKELAEVKVAFLKDKIDFQQDLVSSKLDLLEVKKTRAQQKIEYFQVARKKFDVTAPIDGVVLYVPKRDGRRWEIGESVWMMAKILKVADISSLQVEAKVLEVDAARVKVGQEVAVSVDALPGRVVDTSVGEVGRMVHERSLQDATKVFDVYLPLDGSDESMRPGMSVQVSIEVENLSSAVVIPIEAVVSTDRGTFVDTVTENGRVERVPVELGPRQDNQVVVTTGLEGGETLSLAGAGASS